VSWRSVGSVGGVFDSVVSSATAVFEHVKDELTVIPCLLLATLYHVRQGVDPSSPWGAHRRGSAQSGPVQSSPVPVQCECIRQQLHAALTLPICRLKQERERVGQDRGIRGFSVSSRTTCCVSTLSDRVCLHCPTESVYTVAVRSQSTHHIRSNTSLCCVMAMLRV